MCQMCVEVSHVFKGTAVHDIHGVSFILFYNDRSLLLLYCASQAPPAFLSWVCILFCLLTLQFLFMEAYG